MLTIAWDVDDVLNDLMREWFESEWKPKHDDCYFNYDDISKNPPHEFLQISVETYLASLDAFRRSSAYGDMRPLKEVRDWFSSCGHKFRHIALTAVPLNSAPRSAQWVLNNFGEWIRTYHFVPSYRDSCRAPSYDTDKGSFLKWFEKVDYLIDDSEENIRHAQSVGVKGIIFPRPWNSKKTENIKSIVEILNNLQQQD